MKFVAELFTDMKNELIIEVFFELMKENKKNEIYLINIKKKKITFIAQKINESELLKKLNEIIYDIAFERDIEYSSFIRVYENSYKR